MGLFRHVQRFWHLNKVCDVYDEIRGNHKLMIESGRYDQIPRVKYRLCLTCGSNQIEDEIHLLLYCSKYSNIILKDDF